MLRHRSLVYPCSTLKVPSLLSGQSVEIHVLPQGYRAAFSSINPAVHERCICISVTSVKAVTSDLNGPFERKSLIMLPSANVRWGFVSFFTKLCIFSLKTDGELDHLYICKRLALDPRNDNESAVFIHFRHF